MSKIIDKCLNRIALKASKHSAKPSPHDLSQADKHEVEAAAVDALLACVAGQTDVWGSWRANSEIGFEEGWVGVGIGVGEDIEEKEQERCDNGRR